MRDITAMMESKVWKSVCGPDDTETSAAVAIAVSACGVVNATTYRKTAMKIPAITIAIPSAAPNPLRAYLLLLHLANLCL